MKQATLMELPDILEILGAFLTDEELLAFSQIFHDSRVKGYLNEAKSCVVFFIPSDKGVWSLHCYHTGSKEQIHQFCIDVNCEFIRTTPECMAVMNIVKHEDRHLRLFMGYFRRYGTKRVATFPNGDTMWVTTRDIYERYKGWA